MIIMNYLPVRGRIKEAARREIGKEFSRVTNFRGCRLIHVKYCTAHAPRSLIIIHSCFAQSADCFLLYHKSALPPSSPFKRPCKCGTLELIAEMQNQYTEYRICFAVGESTKITIFLEIHENLFPRKFLALR